MSHRGRAVALTCLLAILFAGAATAAPVVIRNGSFEVDQLEDGDWAYAPPADWDVRHNGSSYEGGYMNAQSPGINPEAIDGEMIAFFNGGSEPALNPWISQALEDTEANPVPAAEGATFELTFWLGRHDGGGAGIYAPVIEAILEVDGPSGWQTFASATHDSTVSGLERGHWEQVHMTLVMTGVPANYVGEQVVLTLFNRTNTLGDPAYYGEASLDAISMIPEPGALSLMIVGALGLIRRRRSA
ncbi:MAG: PEP-CTERM sorting domain-containing protein [Phycisphaerae bacterium]